MECAVVPPHLKVILIGNLGAGKSSLMVRFADDTFDFDKEATVGVDFRSRVLEHNGNAVRLTIWDSAGEGRYSSLVPSFYRGTHGCVIVYNICERESFEGVQRWLNEFEAYCPNHRAVRMLVGNKIDQEVLRAVSEEEGFAFAQRHRLLFMETSARSGQGVTMAFGKLVEAILDAGVVDFIGRRRGFSVTQGSQTEACEGECDDCVGCEGACSAQ